MFAPWSRAGLTCNIPVAEIRRPPKASRTTRVADCRISPSDSKLSKRGVCALARSAPVIRTIAKDRTVYALGFVPQPEIQSEVRTQAPLVCAEQAGIYIILPPLKHNLAGLSEFVVEGPRASVAWAPLKA
jgi:hypothetical protein